MTPMYFEDHPTNPDKVILRKPKHDDDDIQDYVRPWIGLTDEEVDKIYEAHHNQYGECESVNFGYERAIEAKLKEKNA